MKNALLEIGVENLPARFVAPALKQLKENAAKLLAEQRLGFESVTAEGTYRRLALILEGLDDRSKDLEKEVSGPPASLLKDSNGDFTAQSAGFARSQGTSPDKLYVIKTAKGEFLCAKKIIKGSDAGKILSQIFPQLIASLQFPKNMIWESSKFKFARPIRWIVALCDGKIVPFKIADVKAGKKTTGLSAMGGKSITISKPQEYFSKLGQQCIVAEVEKRRKILKESVEKAARRLGYIPCADQELAEENLFLTENPIAVAGNFSVRFLKLPKELIKTVLKNQLKFFPLTDEKGNIQPHFIAVRDGVSENQKEVCSGYEAVVEARLSDAVFFFEKDLACPL
ncbi:MAG: glycine--tRNA ligase subunit beta, partial [Elusimicrobia bacterium]|nr:glycine--tRNA ligase subunit beta [Elusimicrobiota bacterium]